MATVPRLPVIQAKPVTPAQRSAMDQAGRGSGLLDPTRTGHDPAYIAQLRAAFMGQFGRDLTQELQAFNPLHPEGLVNLAGLFTPGPKGGGKWSGITANQQRFLEQLRGRVPYKNVQQPKEWGPGEVTVHDPLYPGGKHTGWPALEGTSAPVRPHQDWTPEVQQLAEQIGHGTGHPVSDLWNTLMRGAGPQNRANAMKATLGQGSDTPMQLQHVYKNQIERIYPKDWPGASQVRVGDLTTFTGDNGSHLIGRVTHIDNDNNVAIQVLGGETGGYNMIGDMYSRPVHWLEAYRLRPQPPGPAPAIISPGRVAPDTLRNAIMRRN
jgi:hypothetical protein